MNFNNFLVEAQRVKDLAPAADSPDKKAVRAPGDVGKVERLQQMNKGKSATVGMPDTADRMAAAGPTQQAADKVLADLGWKGQDKIGTKQVKRDYSNPDQYARATRELDTKLTGADYSQDTDDGSQMRREGESLTDYKSRVGIKSPEKGPSLQSRMSQADLRGKDRITAMDKSYDDALETAYAPTAREGLRIPRENGEDIVIPDSGYLRHGTQASGIGIKQKLDDDDLEQIIAGTLDPDKADTATGLMDKTGTETLGVRTPTARDLETHSAKAEKTGIERDEREYLTPEVQKAQEDMRTALDDQNSEKVQELAFNHEVSDEIIDSFLGKFGRPEYKSGKTGKWKLLAALEGRGLDEGRNKSGYGGDLGKEGDEFRNEDGTYDLNKMKKKNKGLYDQAVENRGREMVRTYLRQGGKDAYARHEGIRSILDMDLEHIRSLTVGGGDGPENWVWASGELNKLRGNRDLVGAVSKYAGDKEDTSRLKTKDIVPGQVTPLEAPRGKTLKSFLKSPSDKKKFEDDFGGMLAPTARGTTGTFEPENYDKLSRDEVQGMRDKFIKNYGGTPEQAETIFPNPGRLSNRNFEVDRTGYERDVTTTERDSVMYKKLISSLKDIYGKKTEDKLLDSPEGQEGMRQLRDMQAMQNSGESPEEIAAVEKPKRKRLARL